MGIARAIRRVKRQAKQGGLNAVITGLGEGLRSRSVPAPLRGAARKIAAIIDPSRASHKTRVAGVQRAVGPSNDRPEIDPGVARPPAEVTTTGNDTGEEPSEPEVGTPVDALAVGATPTYNATPVEVAPVDATPVEVTPVEVKAVEIDLHSVEVAEPASADEAAPQEPVAESVEEKATPSSAKGTPKTKTAEGAKEKLAASGGAAKSVARSGSRAAKKPASTKAGKTSKKK